jgi:threonine dehydrogenase-like Zn-dependent dehydrogenase
MKALCWHGKNDVRIDNVPDPAIEEPSDIIVKVTATAICGSDLHLLDGYVPAMKTGDVLGHEFMGEVVEVGGGVQRHNVGDRVVVPFVIACGHCYFCERELFSCCDTTNPDAEKNAALNGHAGAGLFGYSHLYGGYAGGQAEYVRVPHADHGPIRIGNGLPDEKVLFLSDILPTGWMAAENCNIKAGDTVAIWGAGPVGQMTIVSAWALGAGRVIVVDDVPERLELARSRGKAETIDFGKVKVFDRMQELTGGRGPDSCVDAVGLEAHGWTIDAAYDRMKTSTWLATDRLHVLREIIWCCRKAGTLSVPGVYAGFLDKLPFGAAFAKGLTIKMGQTHVQKYLPSLLAKIESGELDPSFIITHRVKLDEAPEMYKTFRDRKDGCIKVVMTP